MNKRKFNNRFLAFFATLAVALGVGVSLKTKAPVVAKAVAVNETKLYLKPSENWQQAGARFATYFFNSDTDNEWVGMEKQEGTDDIYVVTSPAKDYAKFILCRMDPANPVNDWASKWNQTNDLEFDGTNDLVVLSGNGWDKDTLTYEFKVFDPSEYGVAPFIPAGTELYFRPDEGFYGLGYDHMAAYFYNGEVNLFVDMVEVEGGVFKVTAPAEAEDWERVIFVSSKEGETTWDTKINQTGNIAWDGESNLYDFAGAAWETYTEPEKVTVTPTEKGIDNSKVRIWLNRGGHYADSPYQFVLKVGETHYGATDYSKALVDGEVYFAYFDVPLAELTGKTVELVVLGAFDALELTIDAGVYAAKDNSKLWTVAHDEETDVWSVNKGAVEGRVFNTFVADVLQGYLTCSSSTDNGHGAFPDMDANFIPRDGEGNMNVEGDIGGLTIPDYAGVGTEVYDDLANLTGEVDAWDKYLALEDLGGGEPGEQHRVSEVANNSALYILVIGMLLVSASAIFLHYRKKARVA